MCFWSNGSLAAARGRLGLRSRGGLRFSPASCSWAMGLEAAGLLLVRQHSTSTLAGPTSPRASPSKRSSCCLQFLFAHK